MTRRKGPRRDALEAVIEAAFRPGQFIGYRADSDFVEDLEAVAGRIETLVRADAERAAALYETFLAGCYEKADEVDGSSGNFGMFIDKLFCAWIKARQAARCDASETAVLLLDRMENDPYAFAYQIERDAVKVMNREGLAAFERAVRRRFDAKGGTEQVSERPGQADARHRWGEVLRATYVQQRDLSSYIALCEQTELSAGDCLAVAGILKARRKPDEALAWVDRGLALGKNRPHEAIAENDLARMKRALLTKLGRSGEALEEAWVEFREHPSTFSYEELMRFVPASARAAWHAKAMDAAEGADLGSLIELWLQTREIERLVARLRTASDAALERLSHHWTEPAASRLTRSHPDVAAKVYRALGMRILNAKKARYYDAAVSHFEDAKRCYERAGLGQQWDAVVGEIRQVHRRKVGFMVNFERLVAGHGPSEEPSFLDRARRRWGKTGIGTRDISR
jgi:tetratricopeptide (TPR) repeat protein